MVKCLTCKGVILELVGDMTAEAHFAAMLRVWAQVGLPLTVISDRGTNMVKSNLIMNNDALKAIKKGDQEVQKYSADHKIKFRLNPAYAKHMGEIHESEN